MKPETKRFSRERGYPKELMNSAVQAAFVRAEALSLEWSGFMETSDE